MSSATVVLDALQRDGEAAASLVLPGTSWIHRRVQSMRYVEPELMEVRLSIDFTLPADTDITHVPLTVLPKWPPLFRFDYSDAGGLSIPLLTSEENGAADYGLMMGLTKLFAPSLLGNTEYMTALSLLAKGPDTHLEDAFDTFFESISSAPDTDPGMRDRLADLGATLVDSTHLWCPTVHCGEQRTVVKLSYMLPVYNYNPWYLRVLRSLALYQPTDNLPLPHLGADANYHVELEAPPLLLIRGVDPKFFWLTPNPEKAEADVETTTAEAESAGLRPEQFKECEGRFAHVYISGIRPMGADLYYCLAPACAGFIAAAFTAGVLVAAFVTGAYIERASLVASEHLDATVALLALMPVLIAYLVVRPSDPPLVRRHLLGVQIVGMANAAIPIIMAGLLVVYSSNAAGLEWHWFRCMIAAWACVAVLFLGVLRTGRKPVL